METFSPTESKMMPKFASGRFLTSHIPYFNNFQVTHNSRMGRSGKMASVLEWDIVVSNFKLKTLYYFHLRTLNLGKDIKPLYPSAMG